jgi:outer membrane protein assembly factor BamB
MIKVFLPLILALLFANGCARIQKLGLKGPRPEKKAFRPIWIKNHDPGYDTGNLPIGLQSPVIHQGILYIGHNSGYMFAYELENGRTVWSTKDKGAYHAAPVVYDESVIYGTVEGRVYRRHRLNGKLEYEVDLGASIESEPVIAKGRLFVHTRNHKIFCLDVKTGKILWAYRRSVPFLTTLQRVSRPLIRENKLYVGFADGVVAAFSIEEGILLWETKVGEGSKFVDVDARPYFYRGKILIGPQRGQFAVINPINGMLERRLPYQVSREPMIWKNRLILPTVDGELVFLDKNFKKENLIKISKAGISSIVPWKNGLAVSTVEGELFYLDGPTVAERIHFGHEASAVFSRLQVSEETLALFSSRNRLYVFQ